MTNNKPKTKLPKRSPYFFQLLDGVRSDQVPIRFGHISSMLLERFDTTYYPESDNIGGPVLDKFLSDIADGNLPSILVFERGHKFIVPDDYYAFAALRLSGVKLCPCYVLGEIKHHSVSQFYGPLNAEDIKLAFGGSHSNSCTAKKSGSQPPEGPP